VPEPIEIVEGSPAELQLTQYQAAPAADGFAPENSGAAGGGVRVRFPGAGQTKSLEVGSIAELEIALSQTVVLPTEHWQFGPLRAASEEMLAAANSPGEKAQLREVLERIAEFERIQQNRLSPASVAEAPRTQNPPAQPTAPAADPTRDLTGMVDELRDRVRADLEGKPAAGGGDQFAEEPLYDAVGRLKPVVSKRENAPQFALVDERGDVISFVTPAPDLNLSRYVGQRIGVNGSRGFMPEYRRAHVTAARVTPVEGTVRR
jgi:hypothetical protein